MFIYKIWKEDCEDFYIGSTVDFHNRKYGHKGNCNNPKELGYNCKIYQHIRANGGWDSWNMDIIEECEDRDREKEIIIEMKPSLNSIYYDFDRKEYQKKWWKENIDRLKEQKKKYRQENFDKIKEKEKKWREENADILKEKRNKKYSCECGGKYTYIHRQRHFKSIKHQKYLGSS